MRASSRPQSFGRFLLLLVYFLLFSLLPDGKSIQGYGTHRLGVELFKGAAGIKMINVQYKGGGPAAIDLIGGHIEAALFDMPVAVTHVPTGKMRALAVTSGARIKQLPAVPTTAEAGYPTVRSDSWYAAAVPVAVNADLLRRINKLWVASLRAQDVQDQLSSIGTMAVGSSIEDVNTFRAAEARKWGEVIRKINFRIE